MKIRYILAAVIFICSYSFVYPQEITPYKKHAVSALWENDLLNFIHYDRYYTNGVRFGYFSKEYDYSIETNPMEWSKNISVTNYQQPHLTRFHISLNQEMHTPETHDMQIKNDHIYGGFLYINAGLFNRTYNTLEHIGIKTGITGPYSFAGQLQTLIHIINNKTTFEEWDRQLKTEFIFNPYYQWTGRAYIFKTNSISMDFLGTFDIALGNIDTHFGAYGTIRLGYNLDNDFGIQRMVLSYDAAPVHSDKFSIYVFAGGGPKVTLYNLFVTGNSKTSSLGYDLNLLKWEASCGFVISYYGIRIGYSWTYYTKDYVQQLHNHHIVGSLFGEISF